MFIYWETLSRQYPLIHICLWGTVWTRGLACMCACLCVSVLVCFWIVTPCWHPSPPCADTHTHTHTHTLKLTIALGQGWVSSSCLLKPWLYWVAGVAAPFHTINLVEGFFLLRSCSHYSDRNVFFATFFVACDLANSDVYWECSEENGSHHFFF